MISIDIHRTGRALPITVDIDDKTVFFRKLMGEHHISSEFFHNSASALDVAIGDYITYPASALWTIASGENYYINQVPAVVKVNDSTFKYNIDFQANFYNLNKKLFKDGTNGLSDFAYDGSPADFINKIRTNINEINPTWASGTISSGIDKTLQFTNESCLSALSKVAEAYKMEYDITNKTINLYDSISGPSGYSFEYGRENGLYKLTREPVLNQNIITRCYGFGGQTNIPDTYRNGNKRLIFAASGMAASGYLDNSAAQSLYGIIEGVYVDDNIFPERTGTIEAVSMNFDFGGLGGVARIDKITRNNTPGDCAIGCNGHSETMIWDTDAATTVLNFFADNYYKFGVVVERISDTEIIFIAPVAGTDFAAATIDSTYGSADNLIANVAGSAGTDFNPDTSYIEDTSINFDINNYIIEGQTASVVFKSGDLSGVQCEIASFDYATKRIYLNSFTDSDGSIRPDATHLPSIGDTYTLVNIIMPQTYINTAEATLQAATQRYLDENCEPHVIYTLDIDPKDAKLNNISLKAGDRVTIIDTALSINKLIRISSIEYPLVDPYRIKVVLANPIVPYTLQDRLVKAATIITKGALFSTSSPAKGMVPGANNAGAGYFLNAKGQWAVPAASVSSAGSVAGVSISASFPGEGIAYSSGTAWGTSYSTSGSGTVLALTASPVFTGTVTLPYTELYVGDSGLSIFGANSKFVIENNGNAFLQFATRNIDVSGLYFGDPESATRGGLFYDHSNDWMRLDSGGIQRLTIKADGNIYTNGGLHIGGISDAGDNNLIVDGTSLFSGVATFADDLGTAAFTSGFVGSGWKLDYNTDYSLTVDNLTVRKKMRVYELEINKINSVNGGIMVSVANGKAYSVEDINFNTWHPTGAWTTLTFSGLDITAANNASGTKDIVVSKTPIDYPTSAQIPWQDGESISFVCTLNYTSGAYPSFVITENGSIVVNQALVAGVNTITYTTVTAGSNNYIGVRVVGAAVFSLTSVSCPFLHVNKIIFDEDESTAGTGNIIQFAVNDYIRAQEWTGRGVDSYIGKVLSVVHSATLGSAYIRVMSTDVCWDDAELVQIGNSTDADRQNLIYITASDDNNPYIDMLAGVTDGTFTGKQKLRIGNLTGVTDALLGALSGYGLWSDNVYLTGKIVLPNSGMTNEGSLGSSVRIYAGDTYANRATASFRVLQDGKMYASAGVIGGFTIGTTLLYAGAGGSAGWCTLDSADGTFGWTKQEHYVYSQQSEGGTHIKTLDCDTPYYHVALDDSTESTLNLPASGLPGGGSSTSIIISHASGTELGANRYHILGNGHNINRNGTNATGIDIAEASAVMLVWDPRHGGQWYAIG